MLAAAAHAIASARHVVAMTGAGLSAESGIPTFRGDDGLWTKFGEPRMDGYQNFLKDPKGWWTREVTHTQDPYVLELRSALEQAQPNPAHHALVGLERLDVLKATVSQNVDGLEERAGLTRLIEIHGNRSKFRCLGCGLRTPRGTFVPPRELPPPCAQCGGIVKYDSVMFGEPIPPDRMAAAQTEIDRADCILAIGTSGTVRPASGLAWIAHAAGATIIEINPNETRMTPIASLSVRAKAVDALPELLGVLSNVVRG
ncbi:MAG: NAD-dependent protein deacylase [Dehalococcoidia bacterium]|nr:NAD-dependent protein deacylase [Dehalococcoidia bacterium]